MLYITNKTRCFKKNKQMIRKRKPSSTGNNCIPFECSRDQVKLTSENALLAFVSRKGVSARKKYLQSVDTFRNQRNRSSFHFATDGKQGVLELIFSMSEFDSVTISAIPCFSRVSSIFFSFCSRGTIRIRYPFQTGFNVCTGKKNNTMRHTMLMSPAKEFLYNGFIEGNLMKKD